MTLYVGVFLNDQGKMNDAIVNDTEVNTLVWLDYMHRDQWPNHILVVYENDRPLKVDTNSFYNGNWQV